jgi:hypothetical protein
MGDMRDEAHFVLWEKFCRFVYSFPATIAT